MTDETRPMDYRNLLVRYIAHVGANEGIVYLSNRRRDTNLFTDEQWAELRRLAKEAERFER